MKDFRSLFWSTFHALLSKAGVRPADGEYCSPLARWRMVVIDALTYIMNAPLYVLVRVAVDTVLTMIIIGTWVVLAVYALCYATCHTWSRRKSLGPPVAIHVPDSEKADSLSVLPDRERQTA